jgi:hypothetical protein
MNKKTACRTPCGQVKKKYESKVSKMQAAIAGRLAGLPVFGAPLPVFRPGVPLLGLQSGRIALAAFGPAGLPPALELASAVRPGAFLRNPAEWA